MAPATLETRDEEFARRVGAEIDGLYRYAHWLVGNEAEAEDAVGDTIVRALERREQFRDEASLRAWLRQILYHRAIDRARHRAHEVSVAEVERDWGDERYSVDAAAVLERLETRAELADALAHLPVHYRAVVVAHDAEGWTSAEIAQMTGVSLAAVKQRLRRGRMMVVSALASGEERRMANRDVVMSCVDARARVSDYLDDELGPDERRALEAHLAHCVTCPPLYASLVGVRDLLGDWHDPDSVIPEAMRARLTRRTAPPDGAGVAVEGR